MEMTKKSILFSSDFFVEIKLEDESVHSLGPFSNEKKAIKAIQEFELREFGTTREEKHKTLSPFDFMNSFYRGKNPFDEMNDSEKAVNDKAYSQFMINRAMSMSPENASLARHVSKYKMNNQAHALFWANSAKKPRVFAKWAKEHKKGKKFENQINELMAEYECNRSTAENYYDLLDIIEK